MNDPKQQQSKGTANLSKGVPPPVIFVDLRDRALEATKAAAATASAGTQTGATYASTSAQSPTSATGADDPLFSAVVDILLDIGLLTQRLNHVDGQFNQLGKAGIQKPERILTAVLGLLLRDNLTKPNIETFDQSVVNAIGEYTKSRELFDATLGILISSGFVPAPPANPASNNPEPAHIEVRTNWWAAVTRNLRDQGLAASDPHLDELAKEVLVNLRSADGGLTPSTIEINLPNLEEAADIEIIPPNLHATQCLYFAAMLEELRVFQVVDRLIELFHQGMLPLGKGKAGDVLYRYWKQSEQRLSESERRNLYGRAFGFPGGDSDGAANREFSDLWLRFVSAISSYMRQNSLDDLLTRKVAGAVSQEQVRKAGRDLAANLSLHGYGIAYFAATELQGQIKEIRELLSDPEIKMAFGARDMFQVIDQVATLELGGAKNGIRYRTMAQSGAVIIRWLANRGSLLSSASFRSALDLTVIAQERSSPQPMVDPTDFDLVNACEQWLAVTGTPDQKVEEYAQPSEVPMMTSRPINIPGAARDLLDSVGISAGLAAPGRNRRNGNGATHAAHAGYSR
jgi:hypothetical protein